MEVDIEEGCVEQGAGALRCTPADRQYIRGSIREVSESIISEQVCGIKPDDVQAAMIFSVILGKMSGKVSIRGGLAALQALRW